MRLLPTCFDDAHRSSEAERDIGSQNTFQIRHKPPILGLTTQVQATESQTAVPKSKCEKLVAR